MTQTEEEKFRKFYDGNKDGQSKDLEMKIHSTMMEIIKLKDPEDGFDVFKHVLTIFSEEEMAHLSCLYIGRHLVENLEKSPEFKAMCGMLKIIDNMGKKND